MPRDRSAYKRAWDAANREHVNTQRRAQYDSERQRWYYRLSKYGLNQDAFMEYLDAQEGACALCGDPLPIEVSKISIDHDHGSGEFRGLVHQGCNLAIGLYEKHRNHLSGYLAEGS